MTTLFVRRQVKVTSTVCAYEFHLRINHVSVHSLKSIFTKLLTRLENASVPDSITRTCSIYYLLKPFSEMPGNYTSDQCF